MLITNSILKKTALKSANVNPHSWQVRDYNACDSDQPETFDCHRKIQVSQTEGTDINVFLPLSLFMCVCPLTCLESLPTLSCPCSSSPLLSFSPPAHLPFFHCELCFLTELCLELYWKESRRNLLIMGLRSSRSLWSSLACPLAACTLDHIQD